MRMLANPPPEQTIFGFDIETYTEHTLQKFLCASLVCPRYNIKKFYTNRYDLIRDMKHYAKTFTRVVFYATNLEFDFLEMIKDTEYMYECTLLFRGSSLISGRIPFQKRNRKLPYQKCIQCADTMNFLPISVARMGKLLGIKKLPHPAAFMRQPRNAREWQEMQEYNIQDSWITASFMQFLHEGFFTLGTKILSHPSRACLTEKQKQYMEINKGCRMRLTISSTALDCFRRLFLKDDSIPPNPETLPFIFLAYYGGRTETFQRGTIYSRENAPLYCYDINSAYPYCMLNELPQTGTEKWIEYPKEFFIHSWHGLSDVTITAPHTLHIPFLPWRNEERLLFPRGTFRGVYTHIELRKALALGYRIDALHTQLIYARTWTPFREYVQCLYSLRKEEEEKKNIPLSLLFKLLLNSLYGRMALSPFDHTKIFSKDELTMEEIHTLERDGYRMLHSHIDADFVKFSRKSIDTEMKNIDPILSVYITSYCRILLYSYMEKMGSSLVYVDTDSVTGTTPLPESKELGGVKLEKIISSGVYVKPKLYMTREQNTITMKVKGVRGLNAHLTEEKKNNRRLWQWFHKTKLKTVLLEDGKFSETHFMKFGRVNMSRKDKKYDYHEIMTIHKKLAVEDQKRQWTESFQWYGWQISAPLHVHSPTVLYNPHTEKRGTP